MSHMRANTTLLGHIFGSHPDISGYYEHHLDYHDWRGLIRNKVKFSIDNPDEKITNYYFDKILHNEHHVNDSILKLENVSILFMLRKPERTIKSIMSLYRKIEPGSKYTSEDFTVKYYIRRLEGLCNLAINTSKYKHIYYIDSEDLLKNTDNTLDKISDWLGITPKLDSQYQIFNLSGSKGHGDSSEKIMYGYVSNNRSNYSDININKSLLNEAEIAYQKTKKILSSLTNSINQS